MISLQKRKFGLIHRYSIVGGRRFSNYWWSVILFLGGCGFLLTGISSYFNRNLLVVKQPNVEYLKRSSKQTISNVFIDQHADQVSSSLVLSSSFANDLAEQKVSQKISNQNILENSKFSLVFDRPTSKSAGEVATYVTTEGLEVVNGVPSLPFFPQGLVLFFYGFLGLCFSFHLWFTVIWKIGAGFNEFSGEEAYGKYVRIFRWGRPGKNRRIDFKYTRELIETLKIELAPKPALFLRVKGEKKIPLTRIGEFIPLENLESQAAELTSLLQIPLEIEDYV